MITDGSWQLGYMAVIFIGTTMHIVWLHTWKATSLTKSLISNALGIGLKTIDGSTTCQHASSEQLAASLITCHENSHCRVLVSCYYS